MNLMISCALAVMLLLTPLTKAQAQVPGQKCGPHYATSKGSFMDCTAVIGNQSIYSRSMGFQKTPKDKGVLGLMKSKAEARRFCQELGSTISRNTPRKMTLRDIDRDPKIPYLSCIWVVS